MSEKTCPQAGMTGGTACPTKRVGRTPSAAPDPLVRLLGRPTRRAWGSAAGQGPGGPPH